MPISLTNDNISVVINQSSNVNNINKTEEIRRGGNKTGRYKKCNEIEIECMRSRKNRVNYDVLKGAGNANLTNIHHSFLHNNESIDYIPMEYEILSYDNHHNYDFSIKTNNKVAKEDLGKNFGLKHMMENTELSENENNIRNIDVKNDVVRDERMNSAEMN